MKRLLLLATFSFPAIAFAQQRDEDGTIGSFSLKYKDGYIVKRPSFLYRSLRDARSGRYAYRVRPGDNLYAAQPSPDSHWLRVARHTYLRDSIPKSDVSIYYLPASAVRDKAGTITTFSLH